LVAGAAMEAAASPDADGDARTPAQRRADALVDIFRFFLDFQPDHRTDRNRPHANIVIDMQDWPEGRSLAGNPLQPSTVATLLCDSALHRVLTDGRSTILYFGTAQRTINAALWMPL